MIQHLRSLCASMAAVALLLLSGACAHAQESDALTRGIGLYKAANYADAIKLLEEAVKTQPNSVQAHYCLAVSYRFTGQLADAAREFTWVCDNATMPDLYNRARLGLDSCNQPGSGSQHAAAAAGQDPTLIAKYQEAAALQAQSSPLPGTGPANVQQNPGDTATLRAPISPAFLPPLTSDVSGTGRPKIVDVWSESCVWCKKFEGFFDRARADFNGRIDFASIDGETRSGAAFAGRFGVRGVFPAVIFLGPDGNGIIAMPGCPHNYEEFVGIIHKAYPQLVEPAVQATPAATAPAQPQ